MKSYITLLSAALFSCGSLASPVVLHDAGISRIIPITKYLKPLTSKGEIIVTDTPEAREAIKQELARRYQNHGMYANPGVRLPIRTESLTAARFESRDDYFPDLTIPIFVVGSDGLSIAWLASFREQLMKINAVGWIVQAETQNDLKRISEAGRGLKFLAFQGDYIATQFKVKHYPVLISPRAVEQ